VGLFLGSEGLFGIATEITVRLLRKTEALETLLGVFRSVEAAGEVVTRIMGAGILPVALEMIDSHTMKAVEPFVQAGYPTDAGASLLIEVEGPRAGMDGIVGRIREICEAGGALEVRTAKNDDERTRLWEGRKKAFGAHGRLAPNLYVIDGVVPRTRLAEVIRRTEAIAEKHDLQVGHILHAGDGNLHPNILFDGRVEGEAEKAVQAAEEMAKVCVDLGGTITGEHGVGYEKRDLMPLVFSPGDLAALERLRNLFDPEGICNPGKVFPTSRACGEITARRILDVGWI
jgi:glycolate oxidase